MCVDEAVATWPVSRLRREICHRIAMEGRGRMGRRRLTHGLRRGILLDRSHRCLQVCDASFQIRLPRGQLV